MSVGADALKRAKLLAKRNGVSLSRLVTEGLELVAEEAERRAAARAIIAAFPPEARATKAEKEGLRKQWSTPREAAAPRRRRATG